MVTEAELLLRAKEMRRNPTEPEKHLWRRLSNTQIGDLKFRRQHVLYHAHAIVDFFCPSLNLAIEVDGDTHTSHSDIERDARIRQLGLTILRFANADVMTNIEGVLETILSTARSTPQRW